MIIFSTKYIEKIAQLCLNARVNDIALTAIYNHEFGDDGSEKFLFELQDKENFRWNSIGWTSENESPELEDVYLFYGSENIDNFIKACEIMLDALKTINQSRHENI